MGAGWSWGILLIVYFVASTLLSRFRRADKTSRTRGRLEKPGARDVVQVASNGGWFVLAAGLYWIEPQALWQSVGAGALAASTADTWATELGSLARTPPRSILSGEVVYHGTSGGVTLPGVLASAAGALFVAGIVAAVRWPSAAVWAAIVGGILGSVIDSLLGAAAQARFWCASCGMDTERSVHDCGMVTALRGGVRWLNNDGVNALATASGAAVGVALALGAR
jgi:uncharacterized protein (TIGR00297 family)